MSFQKLSAEVKAQRFIKKNTAWRIVSMSLLTTEHRVPKGHEGLGDLPYTRFRFSDGRVKIVHRDVLAKVSELGFQLRFVIAER
jgi:hypothetical protein